MATVHCTEYAAVPERQVNSGQSRSLSGHSKSLEVLEDSSHSGSLKVTQYSLEVTHWSLELTTMVTLSHSRSLSGHSRSLSGHYNSHSR